MPPEENQARIAGRDADLQGSLLDIYSSGKVPNDAVIAAHTRGWSEEKKKDLKNAIKGTLEPGKAVALLAGVYQEIAYGKGKQQANIDLYETLWSKYGTAISNDPRLKELLMKDQSRSYWDWGNRITQASLCSLSGHNKDIKEEVKQETVLSETLEKQFELFRTEFAKSRRDRIPVTYLEVWTCMTHPNGPLPTGNPLQQAIYKLAEDIRKLQVGGKLSEKLATDLVKVDMW